MTGTRRGTREHAFREADLGNVAVRESENESNFLPGDGNGQSPAENQARLHHLLVLHLWGQSYFIEWCEPKLDICCQLCSCGIRLVLRYGAVMLHHID